MHQELHSSSLFSFAGNLIPFPDHNQSPRNVCHKFFINLNITVLLLGISMSDG